MEGIAALIFGIISIIITVILLILRKDTKTVLLGAGFIMSLAALKPLEAFDAFQKNMVQTGLIWSICSIMGFSFVMKLTEVDKHLVHALAKILKSFRPALIPDVVISTFLVNVSLNSASGVTAAVGTIFIPLLISMGVHHAMAASAVIFGTWASKIGIPHAMLLGSMLCIFATKTNLPKATNEFFNGMGKGYADILGIIICAGVFVSGMNALGLIEYFTNTLKSSTHLVSIATAYGPFILGTVTGSGDASAIVFNNAVTIHAKEFGIKTINMGSLAALGGAMGRAASPIAGATIIAAGIAKVSPFEIAKRTAPGAFIACFISMLLLL